MLERNNTVSPGDLRAAARRPDAFALDPTQADYALDNVQTLQQAVDGANFSQRLGLYLTAAFAGPATMMVIAGLYGVLAQAPAISIRIGSAASSSSMRTELPIRQSVNCP